MLSLDDFNDLPSCSELSSFEMLLKIAEVESQKLEEELQNKPRTQPNPVSKISKGACFSKQRAFPVSRKHRTDDTNVVQEIHQNMGSGKKMCLKRKFPALLDEEEEEWVMDKSLSKKTKNEQKKAKNMKKEKKNMPTGPNPPPDLQEKFKKRIEELGGTEMTLLIQKALFKSDVCTGNNRLSLPLSQIKADFLTETEKKLKEITVPLIQPSLEMIDVVLVKWNMPKNSGAVSSTYNLKTSWMKVTKANGLKEGDVIQVWSFRVQEQLFLALARVI